MNGAKCFPLLHARQGGAASVEEFLSGRDPRDVFIVRREHPAGYLVFSDPTAFFKYSDAKKPHQRMYHEVITEGPQKLRFDIDATAADLQKITLTNTPVDFSAELLGALRSSNAQFQQVCTVITGAICDLHLLLYGRDPDIAVCESVDQRGQKYSRHLIITGSGVSSSNQAREFAKRVSAMINPIYRRFIDLGVYHRRAQNFRLLGSIKKDTDRRKVLLTQHSALDTVIQNPTDTLPDITPEDDPAPKKSSCDLDEVLGVCERGGLLQHHRFRHCRGATYLFDRIAPSHCKFCRRTHDSDNTLVVTCVTRDDGFIDVYQKCRRTERKGELVGSYISAQPRSGDNEKTLEEKQLLRVERDISKAGDDLDPNLFAGCQGIIYDEPQLRDFTPHETLVVHAAMKMGKTKKLRKFIDAHYPISALVPPVIRFVSFRQTFSANIKQNFPDFTLYSEDNGSLSANRLIIQVESLHRLEIDSEPPDLLILDECESIIEQFESGLLRRFSVAVSKFIYLLTHSKSVICMDANMTQRTENVLRQLRNRPIYYHRNVHRNATNHNVNIVTDRYMWIDLIDASIRRGERIAIPMSSLESANALARVIGSRHPDKRMAVYSSETAPNIKKEHFANINEYWTQFDIVIYTPTVSAGVSFEQKHFDRVYAYFTDQSCNDTTCIQMLGRIRDIRQRRTYVYLCTTGGDYPTTTDDIQRQFYERRRALTSDFNGDYLEYTATGDVIHHTTPYFYIWLENTRARNLSRNNFSRRIITMLRGTGAQVAPLGVGSFIMETGHGRQSDEHVQIRAEYLGEKAAHRSENNSAVAAATDLEEVEAEAIVAAMVAQDTVSPTDILRYKKHCLRDAYHYYDEIDEKFVGTYNSPHRRAQYKNLCQIGDCTDEDLQRIQRMEKASYTSNMSSDDTHYLDVRRKYMYRKHYIAVSIMRELGWPSLRSRIQWKHIADISATINPDRTRRLIADAVDEFELRSVPIPDDRDQLAQLLVHVAGQVLTMYDVNIERSGEMYILRISKNFVYEPNGPRPVIQLQQQIEEYGDDE